MRILLLSIALFFLGFFSLSLESFAANPCANAATAVTNITCPQFVISLSQIDPVTSGATVPVGVDALKSLLTKIANLLLFVIPIIAGVSLIIAGYYYILSSGDSEKASQAKTIIKWNLVAIVIALFSYSLIYLLATILDGAAL